MRLDEIESNKYYHVSPTENEDSILKNGLKPMMGDHSSLIGEKYETIYLFTSYDALETALGSWMGDLFDDDELITIFEVTVPDRNLVVDHDVGFEVEYHGIIPPEHVKVLYRDYGPEVENERMNQRDEP